MGRYAVGILWFSIPPHPIIPVMHQINRWATKIVPPLADFTIKKYETTKKDFLQKHEDPFTASIMLCWQFCLLYLNKKICNPVFFVCASDWVMSTWVEQHILPPYVSSPIVVRSLKGEKNKTTPTFNIWQEPSYRMQSQSCQRFLFQVLFLTLLGLLLWGTVSQT